MRRPLSILVACAGLYFASVAAAQPLADITRFCGDSHPEVRLDACGVLIEQNLATGAALADAYASRGTAYSVTGDQGHAIEDFTHALAIDPNRGLIFGYRGNAYLQKKDNNSAIADYTEAVTLDARDTDAFYGRGTALRAKGDNDGAIADFTRVIALDPDYVEAYAFRGIAYAAKDEPDRAIEDYNRVMVLNPGNAQTLDLRGSAYRDKGDIERAEADFGEALKLAPADLNALENHGFIGLLLGLYPQAAVDFAQAVRLQPSYPYNALWLDLARRKNGAPDTDEFARNTASFDLSDWPGPILHLYRGETTTEAVRTTAAADGNDHACEAAFYLGELELATGDPAAAKADFEITAANCPHRFMEYAGAVRELMKLR